MIARLIAYLFVGSFCVAGPLLLVIGLGSAVQRAVLVCSGLHAQGTVIAKRSTGSTRRTYAPVFQFTASDGHDYVVSSDVFGAESSFNFAQRVPVLYRHAHPESARIDAFAQLWTFPLVFGAVGGAFSVIPALVLANRLRARRAGAGGPVWAPTGTRLYHAFGGAAITAMALLFGWVALFGEAAGFSGGVGIGGAALTSSGPAAPARIAFGFASTLFALASLWAWRQVFLPRR